MDNAGYVTLTRQSGLLREIQSVAHNIANASTTGFRREGVLYSEYIQGLSDDRRSLSMANANTRAINSLQGTLEQTGGTFDLAIEGDGFFLVEGPNGQALTRNGVFSPNQDGELVTPDGYRLLDGGGAPVFIPPGIGDVAVASDGTVSADGQPLNQIGLYNPLDPTDLVRETGVLFSVSGDVEPLVEGGRILQGYLENSNVNPVLELARMIEVQQAYQLGQTFMEREDERIRSIIQTLGRA